MYMNARAEHILQDYEENNKVKFDFVLRTRPDAILTDRFDAQHLISQMQNIDYKLREGILFLDRSHKPPLIGDQFTFGNRAAVSFYNNLWNRLDSSVAGYGTLGRLTMPHLRLVDYVLSDRYAIWPLSGVVLGLARSETIDSVSIYLALQRDLESCELSVAVCSLVERAIQAIDVNRGAR